MFGLSTKHLKTLKFLIAVDNNLKLRKKTESGYWSPWQKNPQAHCRFPLIYLPCIATEDTAKRNLSVFKPEDKMELKSPDFNFEK